MKRLENGAVKAKKQRALGFGLGALLGLAAFLLVYGASTLHVTYDSWIYAGYIEGDVIQHHAGWLYYRASEWSWPLTVAENLSQPIGASIAFTDSIPLVAVFCKLLSPLLPATFQYFGLVNCLNLMLQGGFAMLLLGELRLGRAQAALGSLLFVFSPVLLERTFRHGALGAQWLILAALWLYFVSRHTGRYPKAGFFVLLVLTVCIHSYFMPMVLCILLAALVSAVIKSKRWLGAFIYIGICAAGVVAVMYPLGLLTRSGGGAAEGYGSYNMNLNALINPSSFDWYAESGHLSWSRVLPVLAQDYHQYDGFNYLGLGVLAALAAACVYGLVSLLRAKDKKAALGWAGRRLLHHWPLLLVCAALSVFAVSNVVTWGAHTLFELPLPGFVLRLCSIFRASGRMFWVSYYLLLLAAILAAARLVKGRWSLVALSLLCAVQLFDMSGTLAQKRSYFANGPVEVQDEFSSEGWIFLMENYDRVTALGNLFEYELAAGVIRFNSEMQTNLILTNRGNFAGITVQYEQDMEYLLSGGRPEEGVLYMCSDEETFAALLAAAHPDAVGYQTGHYYVLCIPVESCPLPAYLPE